MKKSIFFAISLLFITNLFSQGNDGWGVTNTIVFEPIFIKINDAPIFGSIIDKTIVKKSDNDCSDCNKSSLEPIKNNIFQGLRDTNRYELSNNETFGSFDNTRVTTFIINNITYNWSSEMGAYTCEISLTVVSDYKINSPKEISFKKETNITIRSGITKRGDDKESAYASTLGTVQKRIKNFVYKNDPILLEIEKIELDKKGKPIFIVFTESNFFPMRNRLNFNILDKDELHLKGNSYNLKNSLGKIEYEKKNIESQKIKLKIKSNKLKGNLIDYIENEKKLAAFINY